MDTTINQPLCWYVRIWMMPTLMWILLTNHILTNLLYTYRLMLMYFVAANYSSFSFSNTNWDGYDNQPTVVLVVVCTYLDDADPDVDSADQPYTHQPSLYIWQTHADVLCCLLPTTSSRRSRFQDKLGWIDNQSTTNRCWYVRIWMMPTLINLTAIQMQVATIGTAIC
jgi:hypothetical protein